MNTHSELPTGICGPRGSLKDTEKMKIVDFAAILLLQNPSNHIGSTIRARYDAPTTVLKGFSDEIAFHISP